MSHNRVHANKSTFDTRAQHHQTRREPSLNDTFKAMMLGYTNGYSDRPAWRWQGRGTYDYLHGSDDAARYVAQCRQREIDKMNRKLAKFDMTSKFDKLVQPLTDSARLIEAAANVPDRRAA